jgi:endoglucanase
MLPLLALLALLVLLLHPTSAEDCSTITVDTGPSIDSTGFVTTHGKPKLDSIHLVDASGQAMQLIGVSSHNILTFSNCYTYAALQHLVTEWGITVFRITVYLEEYNGYYSNPSANDAAIAQLVSWCESLGIYAIIDYHVHEIGDPNHYLDYMGAPTGPAITFWETQANLYKDKDHVIYEIANEPNYVEWSPNLIAYLNSVIAAIRAIDSETIIIAGVPQWSQALYYPGEDGGVTNTHNVMYAFHFYAAAHLFLYDVVEQYSRTLPILVSEWSPSSWDSVTEPNLDNANQFVELFTGTLPNNPQMISSTVWNWGDKGGEEVSLLTSGACGSQNWGSLTCSGKYMKNYVRAYRTAQATAPTRTPTATPTISPSQPTDTVAPSLSPTASPTKSPSPLPSSSPSTPMPTGYVDSCVADPSLLVKVRKK